MILAATELYRRLVDIVGAKFLQAKIFVRQMAQGKVDKVQDILLL